MDVLAGQGLRLQIVNCATTRYFRLRLTDRERRSRCLWCASAAKAACSTTPSSKAASIGTFDTKYDSGEILVPPGSSRRRRRGHPGRRAGRQHADPVDAGLPATRPRRQHERLRGAPHRAGDAPERHRAAAGRPTPSPTATPLRAAVPAAAGRRRSAPATGSSCSDPAAFVPPKPGMSEPGHPDHYYVGSTRHRRSRRDLRGLPPYPSAPHIGSSRYAEEGRTARADGHEREPGAPSVPPARLLVPADVAAPGRASPTLTRGRTRSSGTTSTSRPTTRSHSGFDSTTASSSTARRWAAALGRWLFHCHIFFHHHQGMISELVVTGADGREKPNVDVGGSWAYAPSGGTATRHGHLRSPDGSPMTLTASVRHRHRRRRRTGVELVVHRPRRRRRRCAVRLHHRHRRRRPQGPDGLPAQGRRPDDGADNGDPHISTVDGTYYDFQAAGEFTLLRDTAGFEVQVRQTPVPTANPIVDSLQRPDGPA